MILKIYTDGSCSGNPGPGGWGVCYVMEGEIRFSKSGNDPDTTNNRMELTAVVEALNGIGDITVTSGLKRIDVYTDSAYVVNCVKNGYLVRWSKCGWRNKHGEQIKHKDLWLEILAHLKKPGRKVNIIKVKGHSDDVYNGFADALATKETKLAKCGDVCYSRHAESVA